MASRRRRHRKKNRSVIIIHRKINYRHSDSNQSQTTVYHRSAKERPSILRLPPSSSLKQYGEVIRSTHKQRKRKKRQCSLRRFFCVICCIFILIGLITLIISLLIRLKMTQTTKISRFARYNVNMVINGDAEMGACEMGTGVTSPTGWNYNGSITQTHYNITVYNIQTPITPGPSDRGNCFFSGQLSKETTMWQTIDLSSYIDSFLIDNQLVRFNLSAWLGGYGDQDDRAKVTLLFYDQFNQTIGAGISIGPVFAIGRGNVTSLVFRQTNGLVPIGTRFFEILVTITLASGSYNNGNVDNIKVTLYP